jgi:hypothetical protein
MGRPGFVCVWCSGFGVTKKSVVHARDCDAHMVVQGWKLTRRDKMKRRRWAFRTTPVTVLPYAAIKVGE